MKKRKAVPKRTYLLEIRDSSAMKHFFQIEANSVDEAHEQSESLIMQYMTAVSKIHQNSEEEEPLEHAVEGLSLDSKYLVEQSQARLINPEFSDLPEEGIEMLHHLVEKGKRGQTPVRETFLWQIREVH